MGYRFCKFFLVLKNHYHYILLDQQNLLSLPPLPLVFSMSILEPVQVIIYTSCFNNNQCFRKLILNSSTLSKVATYTKKQAKFWNLSKSTKASIAASILFKPHTIHFIMEFIAAFNRVVSFGYIHKQQFQ